MKKFFTQPIGSLVRQNAIGFIACNIYLIGTGFELFESVDGVNRIFNFAWAFTLTTIVIGSYYLVEGQVPNYWKMAIVILGAVLIHSEHSLRYQYQNSVKLDLAECILYGHLTH